MKTSELFVNPIRERMRMWAMFIIAFIALGCTFLFLVQTKGYQVMGTVVAATAVLFAGKQLFDKYQILNDTVVLPPKSLLVSQKQQRIILDVSDESYEMIGQEIKKLKNSCGKLTLVRYGDVSWDRQVGLIDSKALENKMLFFKNDFVEVSIRVDFAITKDEALQNALSVGKKLKARQRQGFIDLGDNWVRNTLDSFDVQNEGAQLSVVEYFARFESYIAACFYEDFKKHPKIWVEYMVM